MINDVKFITGNEELLDEIKLLWEATNREHHKKSIDFKELYEKNTYNIRKSEFLKISQNGEIFIAIAQNKLHQNIGYCVSSIVNKVGMIESIYIMEDYRKRGIANELMLISLDWIKKHNPEKVSLTVAVGNEEVLSFYKKFGFYPRLIEMEQK